MCAETVCRSGSRPMQRPVAACREAVHGEYLLVRWTRHVVENEGRFPSLQYDGHSRRNGRSVWSEDDSSAWVCATESEQGRDGANHLQRAFTQRHIYRGISPRGCTRQRVSLQVSSHATQRLLFRHDETPCRRWVPGKHARTATG